MAQKSKTARVVKRSADMIHSDSELAQKMEPAVQAPEASPSNTELVENSHAENGASPVLDGDLHSPERANVNAMREAIETQTEMEVGKPIAEKQEEVKTEEAGKTMEIDAQPGKQIIINIASSIPWEYSRTVEHNGKTYHLWEAQHENGIQWDQPTSVVGGTIYQLTHQPAQGSGRDYVKPEGGGYYTSLEGLSRKTGIPLEALGEKPKFSSWDYPAKKAAFLNPKTARFLTIDEVKKAGQEYLNQIRTAAVTVSQGQDDKGFHMVINMGGREYALYGEDADKFRKEYAAIPKPENKVNALVEKFMWKLQPYEQKARPAKITQTPESKSEKQPDIDGWLHKTEPSVQPDQLDEANYWAGRGAPSAKDRTEAGPDINAWLRQKEQEENVGKPAKITKTPDIPSYLKKKQEEEYTRFGVPGNNYASVQKNGGVFDWMRSKKKPEDMPQVEQPKEQKPATKIPARVRVHQEALGFGQLQKGLEQDRGFLVGTTYPGYAEVEFRNGQRKVVPTFALLTTKAGWKFLNDQTKQMDDEHVAQCGDPNCNRCGYIPGTPARKRSEEFMQNMQIDDEKHRQTCTKSNCPHGAHRDKKRPAQASKKAQLKTADYEGWSNWATWHVNLLIDNTESSYNSKRRLAANAVKKGIGLDQLANQFNRMFRKQFKETKEFHENNAADSRDARGAYERKKLEGHQPNKQYQNDTEKQQYLKDVVDDMFYGIGGQSGWEEPFEEVNWREIAQHAMDNEREEGVPEAENPKPFSKEDEQFLKDMKIQGSKQADGLIAKGSKDMDKNKKKANPMDTVVEPMAPVTSPSTPEIEEQHTEVEDPVLVKQVADELFPGFDFAELSASQQRDVISVARERKSVMAAAKKAGEGKAKNESEVEKEAGFNFFFPGQVLKEFYPEMQHEIVDYPNQNNTAMGLEAPEMVGDGGHDLDALVEMAMGNLGSIEAIQLPGDIGDVEEISFSASDEKTADASTSPAGGMGIGRDGKSQVLEGVPLRKENDIRGPGFTEEFYGQYQGINGKSLTASELQTYKSAHVWQKKTATVDEAEQFVMFLKKVVGEIAATMVAAFKVTSRPLLDKVPGVGEVQLAQIEQPQGMSTFNTVNTGSRVKYLMDKLNDSEIQDAINDAWAQGAVWHDGGKGGYVYEVFVRAESIDTDSMLMKYKFVAGTRE